MSSGYKFPVVYMCQKLWKLAGSRQSYCKNYLAYFFWPTLYISCRFKNVSSINCAHWCSTVCTALCPSMPVDTMCQQSPRISAVVLYVRLFVEIWLFLPQDSALRSRSFAVVGPSTWKSPPASLRKISVSSYRRQLKTFPLQVRFRAWRALNSLYLLTYLLFARAHVDYTTSARS